MGYLVTISSVSILLELVIKLLLVLHNMNFKFVSNILFNRMYFRMYL